MSDDYDIMADTEQLSEIEVQWQAAGQLGSWAAGQLGN
jgi:hypothetical protein